METFRIAKEIDAKVLAIVRQKSWEATYRGIYSDEVIDNFDYIFHEQKFVNQIRNPEIITYVIEVDGIIIGYFSIGIPFDRSTEDLGLYLYSLYILPAYQQKGIGARVFGFVREYCKNNGIHKFRNACNMHNAKAKIFYTKMGGTITLEDSGHPNKAEDQCYFEYILSE
jgi:ribosomal protein S18 acetylase RimI-like enzyme